VCPKKLIQRREREWGREISCHHTIVFARYNMQEALAKLLKCDSCLAAVFEQYFDQQRKSLFELQRLTQITQATLIQLSVDLKVSEQIQELLLVGIYRWNNE
jgi:acetyl-CoA carboxylase beta subunit